MENLYSNTQQMYAHAALWHILLPHNDTEETRTD